MIDKEDLEAASHELPDFRTLSPISLQKFFWDAINYSCLLELIIMGDLLSYYYTVDVIENKALVALEKGVLVSMFDASGYKAEEEGSGAYDLPTP